MSLGESRAFRLDGSLLHPTRVQGLEGLDQLTHRRHVAAGNVDNVQRAYNKQVERHDLNKSFRR